jgi:excisionase family DNA binding protein
MTIREVAVRLNCSIANVYALVNAGELPVVQVGCRRGFRVEETDLADFVMRRKSQLSPNGGRRRRARLKHIQL